MVYRHVGVDREISMDEAIGTAEGLSRRRFLQMGGLAAGGLALAGSTSGLASAGQSRAGSDGPRVVVVGAGLAGMTAAYRLHQAGVATQVFEARDRVGGRCWSARNFAGGQVAEHGGEFVDTRHVHLRILARELGLQLDDLWSAWVPGSTWLQYVDGELVKGREVFDVMRPAIRRLVEFASSHGRGIAPHASRAMKRFDEASMADWFGREVGSGHHRAYRLWASGQSGWWGADPDVLGAGNVVDYYATNYPHDDERYTIHLGNDQVPNLIQDQLPAGSVHLGQPLESVQVNSSGQYDVRFVGEANAVRADVLVLTLPFTALRDVDLSGAGLSREKLRHIRELGMGTNAKLLLQFDKSFPMGDWSGGMQRGDAPAFGTWESSGTDPHAHRFGLLTVYSGGRVGASYDTDTAHAPAPNAVVDEYLAAIDEVAPGTSSSFNGNAWLDAWVKDPWSRGSYAAFLPTQMTTMFGVLGRPWDAIHFAGEHTSTYSQGFLNGGVESGSRAAAEVLTKLGKPYPDGLAKSLSAQKKFEPQYPWN